MTDERMALIGLIEKQADGDLVREMLAFAVERIMELEVEMRTGATKGARSPLRNALAHASTKQRSAVAAMLKTIFAQQTRADAEAQWEAVADALREKVEKLGTFMDASRDDVLAYMDFPREHWAQIASTNPLERLNGEIKRRANVIGIFANDEAIIRLVGTLMLETNDEWAVARRYMSLETLARVTDNPTVKLPAVAS